MFLSAIKYCLKIIIIEKKYHKMSDKQLCVMYRHNENDSIFLIFGAVQLNSSLFHFMGEPSMKSSKPYFVFSGLTKVIGV